MRFSIPSSYKFFSDSRDVFIYFVTELLTSGNLVFTKLELFEFSVFLYLPDLFEDPLDIILDIAGQSIKSFVLNER